MFRLFKKKEHYKDYEKIVVETIKEKLLSNPDNFSANWFIGKDTMSNSICSKNLTIMVSTTTFNILSPITVELSSQDKKIFKELIEPIYNRSLNEVIEKL